MGGRPITVKCERALLKLAHSQHTLLIWPTLNTSFFSDILWLFIVALLIGPACLHVCGFLAFLFENGDSLYS